MNLHFFTRDSSLDPRWAALNRFYRIELFVGLKGREKRVSKKEPSDTPNVDLGSPKCSSIDLYSTKIIERAETNILVSFIISCMGTMIEAFFFSRP
jgi:hypothetical protein